MSRRKGRAPRGAEIYGWTLFPTTPTDAFGRFMCGNLRNRLGRELWESREAAREAIVAELGADWPVRHWCVSFWQATRREPREESPHYVLCLACMWLGSSWNARDAFVLAREHALDEGADPEQVTDLKIRAWQRGDAGPCWLSPRVDRHHAHSERDPHLVSTSRSASPAGGAAAHKTSDPRPMGRRGST